MAKCERGIERERATERLRERNVMAEEKTETGSR